ncbi:hypothetical protein LCGC14_1564240 [marine sediment metagenome]|uniref:Uncharacterized protein n=1 Tax=marine sediment metagenome TaxID=412755 RepID=A0A0F9L2L2_9ZZZZ
MVGEDYDHDGDLEARQEAWVERQSYDVAPYGDLDVDLTDRPDGWEELTEAQRASYTEMQRTSQQAAVILQKIEAAGIDYHESNKEAPSIRLKAKDCFTLMGWIINLQNIGDLLSAQLQSAEATIGAQKVALDEYEEKTGRKLWTPGPVRP